MMMPANYSVIAENELTYVVGGANLVETLGKYTAPIWNDANIKTFNTNLVTIIGNEFLGKFVDGTLGVLFSGNCTWDQVKNIPGTLVGADKWASKNYGDGFATVLGMAAAIYNLGTASVANKASSAAISHAGGPTKVRLVDKDGNDVKLV